MSHVNQKHSIEFFPSCYLSGETDYSGEKGEYKAFFIKFDQQSYSSQELCDFFDHLAQISKDRFGQSVGLFTMSFEKLNDSEDQNAYMIRLFLSAEERNKISNEQSSIDDEAAEIKKTKIINKAAERSNKENEKKIAVEKLEQQLSHLQDLTK